MIRRTSILLCMALCLLCAVAFVPMARPVAFRSVQLQERRWNFNDGHSPWGLKINAEIWNGRVAQVGFGVLECGRY